MKVRLSVKELRNYFERRNQFTVIFNSENQEWYWVADPLKIRMVFSKVKVLENPNIVSWTFDPNVAMSFYYSRTPPCYLYTAEIEKSDILAVFSPETEREVLQYESAKNIREITEDELGEVCKQCDDYQRLKDCIAGVSELIKLPDSIAQMNSLLKNLKDKIHIKIKET